MKEGAPMPKPEFPPRIALLKHEIDNFKDLADGDYLYISKPEVDAMLAKAATGERREKEGKDE